MFSQSYASEEPGSQESFSQEADVGGIWEAVQSWGLAATTPRRLMSVTHGWSPSVPVLSCQKRGTSEGHLILCS